LIYDCNSSQWNGESCPTFAVNRMKFVSVKP